MTSVTPPPGAGELESFAPRRPDQVGASSQRTAPTASDPSTATATATAAAPATAENVRSAPRAEAPARVAEDAAPGEDAAAERARELAQQLVDDALKPFARLQITRDEESNRFIYTTIDTRSGEIIQQFPREALLNALPEPKDADGVVVDRRV